MSSDSFEPVEAVLKEVEVRFSLMHTPDEFAATFRHLGNGDLDVSPLLSGWIGLDGVPDAFARLATDPIDTKILVDPSRPAPADAAAVADLTPG